MAEDMPEVLYKPARAEHRITVRGRWFPKRDDVKDVIRLREHFRDSLPASLFDLRDDVFLDVIVMDGAMDLDRALSGTMTALDGHHGRLTAALWDDSVIRQARVSRIDFAQGGTL